MKDATALSVRNASLAARPDEDRKAEISRLEKDGTEYGGCDPRRLRVVREFCRCHHSTSFTTLTFRYTRSRERSAAVPDFGENGASPSLNQLQANCGLAVAEVQSLICDDGMVPGFVVEHWQS